MASAYNLMIFVYYTTIIKFPDILTVLQHKINILYVFRLTPSRLAANASLVTNNVRLVDEQIRV